MTNMVKDCHRRMFCDCWLSLSSYILDPFKTSLSIIWQRFTTNTFNYHLHQFNVFANDCLSKSRCDYGLILIHIYVYIIKIIHISMNLNKHNTQIVLTFAHQDYDCKLIIKFTSNIIRSKKKIRLSQTSVVTD